jgi:hypothetical protein
MTVSLSNLPSLSGCRTPLSLGRLTATLVLSPPRLRHRYSIKFLSAGDAAAVHGGYVSPAGTISVIRGVRQSRPGICPGSARCYAHFVIRRRWRPALPLVYTPERGSPAYVQFLWKSMTIKRSTTDCRNSETPDNNYPDANSVAKKFLLGPGSGGRIQGPGSTVRARNSTQACRTGGTDHRRRRGPLAYAAIGGNVKGDTPGNARTPGAPQWHHPRQRSLARKTA